MSDCYKCLYSKSFEEIKEDYVKFIKSVSYPVFYDPRFLMACDKEELLPIDCRYYMTVYEGSDMIAFLPIYLQHNADPFGVIETGGNKINDEDFALLGHIMHGYESTVLIHPSINPSSILSVMIGNLKKISQEEGADFYGLVNVKCPQLLNDLKSLNLTTSYMWDRFRIVLDDYNNYSDLLQRIPRKGRYAMKKSEDKFDDNNCSLVIKTPDEAEIVQIAQLCHKTSTKHGTAHYYPMDSFPNFIAHCKDLITAFMIKKDDQCIAVIVALEEKKHFTFMGQRYDL